MCLEHFPSQSSPSAITTCSELTDCVRNMLSTYDDLWALGWKKHLEHLMVGYFEGFEAFTNRTLDWGFAARMVMQYFHLLQRAALQPDVGIRFNGLVVTYLWTSSWNPSYHFARRRSNWNQKKLIQPAIVIFGSGHTRRPPKGKGKAGGEGNGAPDTTKVVTESKERPANEAPQSTTRFCLGDAFKYLGITGSLDATAKGAYRGHSCQWGAGQNQETVQWRTRMTRCGCGCSGSHMLRCMCVDSIRTIASGKGGCRIIAPSTPTTTCCAACGCGSCHHPSAAAT